MTLAVVVACQNGFYLIADTRTVDIHKDYYTENTKKVFYSTKHNFGVCVADAAMLSDPQYPNDLEKIISVSYIMEAFFKDIDERQEAQIKSTFSSVPAIFALIKNFIQSKFGACYLQQFEQEVSLFFGCVINNQTVIGSYHDQKSITLVSPDHQINGSFVLDKIIVLQQKNNKVIVYYTLGDGKVQQGELAPFNGIEKLPFPTQGNLPIELRRLDNEALVDPILYGCFNSKKILQEFNYSTDFRTKLCAFSNYQREINSYSNFLVKDVNCPIAGNNEIEKQNKFFSENNFRSLVFNNVVLETRKFVLTEQPASIGDYFEYIKIGNGVNDVTKLKLAVKNDSPDKLSVLDPNEYFPLYVIPKTMREKNDLVERRDLIAYERSGGTYAITTTL